MNILATSGKESRIVKCNEEFYLIQDYGTVNELEQEYYHAIRVYTINNISYFPYINEHYLINRETEEISDDPWEYPEIINEEIIVEPIVEPTENDEENQEESE